MTICRYAMSFVGAVNVDIIEISRPRPLLTCSSPNREKSKDTRGERNQLEAQDRAEDDGMAEVSASGVTAIVFHVSVSVRS
jgi:hypothetical protein